MSAARRRRQRREILRHAGNGQLARALVLARAHLTEYPADDEVRWAVVAGVARARDVDLQRELDDLLADLAR